MSKIAVEIEYEKKNPKKADFIKKIVAKAVEQYKKVFKKLASH